MERKYRFHMSQFLNVLNKNKEQVIKDHLENKMSFKKIAKKYGCNSGIVWKFFNDLGIKNRKQRSSNYGQFEKYKDSLPELYEKYNSAHKIAQAIGVSRTSVAQWLHKLDILDKEKDHSNYLLKQKSDIVVDLYQKDYTSYEIAEMVGGSASGVRQFLRRNGYVKDRRYHVKEDFFDLIDTEEKAYILGFLSADGYVTDGHFKLSITDRDILYDIRNAMDYHGPIHMTVQKNIKWKDVYSLCVCRPHMAKKLQEKGLVQNKSLIVRMPSKTDVPDYLLHHFLRGVLDGDGSICKKKKATLNCSIASSFFFCQDLSEILTQKGIKHQIYKRYKDKPDHLTAHQLFMTQTDHAFKFLSWLYKDATIFLQRKKDIFDTWQKAKLGKIVV